jgi:hypothetical protein
MAKKQKHHTKTCADCIHESSCKMWTAGRYISDASSNQCPNNETVKESGAYLCGVLDEKKRKQTNADRIRAWNDHELAETIANFVSEIDNGDVRYSDDPNDWLKWLQQPAKEG